MVESIPTTVGIKRYGETTLANYLEKLGEPHFRTRQLLEWLYAKNAKDYADMSNLPAGLRATLAAKEPIATPELLKLKVSRDGTRKYLLRLADGARIECVGIPDGERLTVCFSTQVGCAMACSFCATGRLGCERNLAPGEMVDQLLVVATDFNTRISGAVAMGEGEPFANYANTLAALRLINAAYGLNIGARHLTVSTSGLISGIKQFADEPEQFTLAISLHSAVQATRDQLMPGLAGQPLAALRQALSIYTERSGRRVSLEYTLLNGINDDASQIEALKDFCRGLKCHINLIPFNVSESDYTPTAQARVIEIQAELERFGVETSRRRSRGSDIAGACGQLAGESA